MPINAVNELSRQISIRSKWIARSAKIKQEYYIDNAKAGWIEGSKIAEEKGLNKLRTFAQKLKCTVKNAKLKREDVPYIVAGATIPTPLPTIVIFIITKLGLKFTKTIK